MVSTRNHPRAFPPPDLSPSKKSPGAASPEAEDAVVYIPASGKTANDAIISARSGARALTAWSHRVSTLTLGWLVFSLPLVLWDVGYCLLRPHTFVGGKWHLPIWGPYSRYAMIDYLYSPAAHANNDGFTGAQSAMNVVETVMYLVYAVLAFKNGRRTGKSYDRRIVGRDAGVASLLAFSAYLLTLAKTVLYVLVGYYSGFPVLRDNNVFDIFFLFIVPNGAWIVVPAYLVYVVGGEILQGLERAAGLPEKKLV